MHLRQLRVSLILGAQDNQWPDIGEALITSPDGSIWTLRYPARNGGSAWRAEQFYTCTWDLGQAIHEATQHLESEGYTVPKPKRTGIFALAD